MKQERAAGNDPAIVIAGLEARIRDLEGALQQRNKYLAATFKLTPALNKLLGLLLALPNVTSEMIRHRLEIATDAKVIIHRLRLHLNDWTDKRNERRIVIESRRSLGYWIELEDKLRIQQYVAETREMVQKLNTEISNV